MSADNTIVVLASQREFGGGHHFRVAHLQAIQNFECGTRQQRLDWVAYVFRNSPVFTYDEPYGETAEERAWKYAINLAAETRRQFVLEYGIKGLTLDEPFPAEAAARYRQAELAQARLRRRRCGNALRAQHQHLRSLRSDERRITRALNALPYALVSVEAASPVAVAKRQLEEARRATRREMRAARREIASLKRARASVDADIARLAESGRIR